MGGHVPVVRWQQLGDSSGAWLLLEPTPGQNRGFVETGRYAFEKPGSGWSLNIDDEPLADVPGNSSQWLWSPSFFAGEVTAELLEAHGTSSTLYLLDVAPDPKKIGREVFGQMIDELWDEDPSLVIGSEPATRRIGDLGAGQNAWLEFARFRRYAPEFLRALAPIRAKPRRALHVRRTSASLHEVRRVDQRTAVALARSPALAVLFGASNDESMLAADSRLDVPIVEETLDASVNRAMLALMLALIRRARTLLDRLGEVVNREADSETRTSLMGRWPVRKQILEDLIARVKFFARQSPFVNVKRPEITAAGLTGIAADPTYARAWGQGWRALRHGLELGERNERLWVSPSWEIYERWCFLRLGKMLAATIPAYGWHRLTNPDRWVGAYGNQRAELLLQPTFRSSSQSRQGLWSVSKERVPDIVLTVQRPDGARLLIFDAKYRTSRSNVLDAMESAHIYQDSLRIASRRPEASLLLIPSGGSAAWLEDPAFHAEHRVGVHVLSPVADLTLPVLAERTLVI
jgi:hypothetical protein